MMYKIL